MFLYCFVLVFGLTSGSLLKRSEVDKYTYVSYTTDGRPCLSGCSVTTNECVINWLWMKKPCKQENELAPIYYTAQKHDKENKICLSNCGKFGSAYEWCITRPDNTWDFCSSKIRGEVPTPTSKNIVDSYAIEKELCKTPCENKKSKGYSCYVNSIIWKYCAKQAIHRIPILPSDYNVGNFNKHNCEAFLTNLVQENFRANVSYFDSEYAADGYIQEVAHTIEEAVKLNPETGIFKEVSEEGSSIKNYTMVNMLLTNGTSVQVPAVIHAFVSNSTIRRNQPLIDIRIMTERNGFRRRRQAYDGDGFFNWRIIGYELGGTDDDYNFIRQSPNLFESWLQMQRAIDKWCENTGGSVDISTVIFYNDAHTTMPKALGVAMSFYNPDGSIFVTCKETIYWNK